MKPLQDAFSPDVMAELARPVQAKTGVVNAVELTLREARWYVVEVSSRHAQHELAEAQFGTYVPVTYVTEVRRGRKETRRIEIISGYVFVFLWETDLNLQRMASTKGVVSVLGWIEDREIDRLRYQESCEQLDADARLVVKQRVLRKVHRKRVGGARRKKHNRAAKRRRGQVETAT